MSKNLSTFDIGMEYQSLSKTKAKELKTLTLKKERDRQRMFIAEGEKCVLDSLFTFNPQFIIASSNWIEDHRDLLRAFGDKVLTADHRTREILTSLNTVPEVIGILKMEDVDPGIPKLSPHKLYVLLDEVQDPGNLGTIIRTCDWFGIYDVFASKNSVDVFNPKVVQATMGSLARVEVRYVDLKELISHNTEIKVIGTVLNGKPLPEAGLEEKGFILLGNEGRGISSSLLELIDIPVTIPATHKENCPDSLNVAVANAIILSSIILKPVSQKPTK